ncbi:hypothetical protein FRX31_018351 [Thalictrum thalictroides]|uniref:EF-hand domain-containing protein n=1 Tax=Thalictrum thalictroides TaxID=46969 RepID=A0A7J6W689_THATH|nr:hypothetical protein FRX31_018351 [Thalictrum thalictroides]
MTIKLNCFRGSCTMTVEEFKEWVDKDKDGRISKEELREALRSVGGWFTTWMSDRGVKTADVNSNGFIDDNEIGNLVSFAKKHLGVKIQIY